MAKIVVVTYTNALDNYGQVLQYYATQVYLEGRGHNVFVHYEGSSFLNTFKKKLKRIVNCYTSKPFFQKIELSPTDSSNLSEEEKEKQILFAKWQEVIERTEKLHSRRFKEFKKQHFHIKRCALSKLHNLHLDACVVGSDQTWSGIWDYFFLDWAPKGAKRIAIAPSVGHKVYSRNEIEKARVYLEKFDLITVREENGVEFCKEAGRDDAIKILDPTFLLSSADYAEIEKKHNQQTPYVLLYLLGGEIGIDVSEIYSFANKEGLDVVYVASQGREDDYPKYYAEVGEWLSLIHDAKYVFTNSFHGMAFSLIYHKPFLVFPLVGIMKGMNGRIYDLSHIMSLNKVYNGNLEAVKDEIDYDYVNYIVDKNKETLSENLKKINL